MKFCVVKDENDFFYGKEYNEGFHYSSYTNQDPSVEVCWKPLSFFLDTDDEDSCGLIIFESMKKAKDYMDREWSSKECTIVPLIELEQWREI